jgi:hypothetical protein
MDLQAILIKAEALFRRFQRLVEAVDKKPNFPGPRKLSTPSIPTTSNASSSTNSRPGGSTPNKSSGKDKEEEQKVITPELRKLLSRQVEVLPRTTVAQKGDGMPSR